MHCTELTQSSRENLQQHQQSKHHQNHLHVNQHLQKQRYQSSQQMKQNSKKLCQELNINATEEDINELIGHKSTEYLHQNCSAEMPIDKNTGKSKGFF